MALVEAGCLDELDVLFHLLLGLEVEEGLVRRLERHVLRRISYGHSEMHLMIDAVDFSRVIESREQDCTRANNSVAEAINRRDNKSSRLVALAESRVSRISNKDASLAAALNNTNFTQLHRSPPLLTSRHSTQVIPATLWFQRRVRNVGLFRIVVARVLLEERRRRRVGRHLANHQRLH